MSSEPHRWRNRSPGDLSVELREVTATEVGPVVDAAVAAAPKWARTALSDRLACLEAARAALEPAREELAHGIAIETGKPIAEALGEVGAVLAKFALTAEDAREHLGSKIVADGPHPAMVVRSARGPAAVVGPFNFPLHLANGAMLAHLAAGNPVVFKPSPLAAVVAERYAELIAPCFPKGVFGLVQGGGAVGQALCLDPRIRAVCFTGSVPVGHALARALADDISKELALELGGHNAAIICADADIDLAAEAVAEGACLTCGQRCNATSRVLADAQVAGRFAERLAEAISKFVPGDPLKPETRLGPLISEAATRRYGRLIAERADWIVRGEVVAEVDGKRGYYVRPAVRRGQPGGEGEIFVPVIEFEAVDSLDEVVQIHNASPFGLTASVFTASEGTFRDLAAVLRAGNVYANLPTTFSPSTLPFGGLGLSGNGRPGGRGFVRFTTVEQALQWRDGSFGAPL